MVYRPDVDQALCFVLMPFREPFNGYYKALIKPAVEKTGLTALRADEIYGTKPIIQDVWEHIWKARVIVADVTDRNPNVNYELGLCHALGIPTILMTKRMDDVPFDYSHRRCIVYETDKVGWEKKLSESLARTITTTLGEASSESILRWPYDTDQLKLRPLSGPLSIENSRQIVLGGIGKLQDFVEKAYGPLGTNISVSAQAGGVISVKQGVGITRGVRSANPIEEHGIDQMRQAARLMSRGVGDGTKTAVLVASEMIKRGDVAIAQGHEPEDVVIGMKHAVEAAYASLEEQAKPVSDDDIRKIASTAAGGDYKIAIAVAEAIKGVGRDGILSIAFAEVTEPLVTFRDGMRFERGYLSDTFVTDPVTGECVLENCRILICDRRIGAMQELLPLLGQVARAGKPLLVIADNVDGEALQTLVANRVRGTLECAAVRSPGGAQERAAVLADIAVLTGGKAFTEELGINLSAVSIADLGSADKVIIGKDNTAILGGRGNQKAIESRAAILRSRLSGNPTGPERFLLQERLTNLVGRIATIQVGGITPADVEDQRYRAESAMHSVQSAIGHGSLCGGGKALLRAKAAISTLSLDSEGHRAGAEAVASALERPFVVLLQTAGKDVRDVSAEQFAPSDIGFNVSSREFEDLRIAGVLDSAHTVRRSIEVAFSCAKTILRTNEWSVSQPRADDEGITQFT